MGTKNITELRILSVICKGPKYRFPSPIDFKNVVKKLLTPYTKVVIAGANESIMSLMLQMLEN